MKKIKNNEIIDYVLSISKNINIKEDTDESISSDFNYDMDSINSLNLDASTTLKNLTEPLNHILDELCDENIFRIGTKHENLINNKKCETSIYWSVLTCLIPNFYEKLVEDRINYINKLVIKFVFEINTTSLYKDNKYVKLGWKKSNLVKNIQTCNISEIVLQFLADYFSLNIFIFNTNKGVIHSYFNEEELNKYKKNIFLLNIENHYEPIFINNQSMFDFNDLIFKVVVDHNRNLIRCPKIDFSSNKSIKLFRIGPENLDKYLVNSVINEDNKKNENDKNNFDELIDSHTNNNVIDLNDSIDTEIDIYNQSEDIFYKKEKDNYSSNIKSISLKLKLTELQDIAVKLNLDIYTDKKTKSNKKKKKTKSELYNNIVNLLT
jgi:hypothetical protein